MKVLWQQIANTTVTEILCSTAMDGVVLDCEHGYWNNETIVDCIRVIRLSRKKPFVRIKGDKQLTQLCYDNECEGIIYSNIGTWCEKRSDYGIGLVKNNFWGKNDITKRNLIEIGQLENISCFENIDEIKRNASPFDYYMIGSYDLSNSIGDVGNFKNETFIMAMKKFESTIPLQKRGIHIVKNFEEYDRYKDYGFIAFSLDTLSLVKGVKELNKYA